MTSMDAQDLTNASATTQLATRIRLGDRLKGTATQATKLTLHLHPDATQEILMEPPTTQ